MKYYLYLNYLLQIYNYILLRQMNSRQYFFFVKNYEVSTNKQTCQKES